MLMLIEDKTVSGARSFVFSHQVSHITITLVDEVLSISRLGIFSAW